MAIIRNKKYVFNQDGSLNTTTLLSCIKEHNESIARFNRLEDYYNGKHAILDREIIDKDAPNNKVMVNYAEYISDFASSYFMGNEIDYVGEGFDIIEETLRNQHIHMVDTELARDLSRFGIAYELVYMSSDESPVPKSTNIDPRNAFIIVDDSVEYKTLVGVHFYPIINEEGKEESIAFNVYTSDVIYHFEKKDETLKLIDEEDHLFETVPMIEYWNKANKMGDYESVLNLIDAYNVLQSDRVNDKEKFVQALLVVYGVLGGDTTQEKIDTVKKLKQLGLLEMPMNTKAEYITKTLSETETEILKDSIKNDIHKISKVPDMTDENFAANASGVAMKYKLLGLEQLTKTKESYYKMSLRERLRIYEQMFKKKGQAVDVSKAEINMTRSLPVNETEIASMVNQLKEIVSVETLLAQIPFVSDVDSEKERLLQQKEENIERQQEMFGQYDHQETVGNEE